MSVPKVELVITDSGELHRLSRTTSPGRVILRLPMLNQKEQVEWQKKINSAANACGCGEGAAFLLAMLVILGLLAIPLWSVVRGYPIVSGMLSLILVVGSVAAGKWYGKLRAAHKLRNSIDALQAILKGRSSAPFITPTGQSLAVAQGDLP